MSRKYALFVGSSEYDSESLNNLESPISDVRDLAGLFRDAAIGGFDEVTELINSVESEIRQAVSSFFLKKKPDDLLLLYFSGHGVLDDRGHLYLAVKDTKPDLLRATAISADFIADDMDLCRSKRQILILDCCHSGAFRRGIKGGGKALTAHTFEGNGSGRIVLTASDRREYAMEGNQVLDANTSLFTHYLLEGIKSGQADMDGDSFISLDEWYDYAYDKVVSKLPTQTPRRWVYNQRGKLIIARNPKPGALKKPELAPELLASIQDQRPRIRLRAASELADIMGSENQRLALLAHEALHNMQNDESGEVRIAVAKILADNDSPGNETAQQAHYPAWMIIWSKLRAMFTSASLSRRNTWTTRAAVAGGLIILTWGVYVMADRSNTSGVSSSNLSKSQVQTGTAENLVTPFNFFDINKQNQQPLIFLDEDSREDENNSPQNSSNPPQGASNPPENEEIFKAKEENGKAGAAEDDISESVPEQNDQQNLASGPTEEGKPLKREEDKTENNPAEPEERPIDRLQNDIDVLLKELRQAVIDRRWAGLPAPLADHYGELLADFYSNFSIIDVEHTAGELQADEAAATLPVTLEIIYKQKGRDDVKTLPLPALWVWVKSAEGFELSEVDNGQSGN